MGDAAFAAKWSIRAFDVCFSGYCLANSVPAPVCTGINRESGRWRCLRARHAGSDCRGPEIFAAAGDVRTALYRFFLKVWDSMPVNGHVDQAGFSCDELGACRSLETISLRPRIAFLLSAIEGFATAEVADTLECSIAEASSLIDAAGREIADQIRTDILIIELEPFIALGLDILVAERTPRRQRSAHASRSGQSRSARTAWAYPRRCSARRRQLGSRSGQPDPRRFLGAGHFHYGLSGAVPDRHAAGASLPHYQAIPPGQSEAIISQALFFDRKSHRKDKSEAITLSSDHTGRGESMFPCLDHSG